MWLHVDGAYGGPAAITPEGRSYLDGIERADSLVLDPHK
jgi:glutamate/tyrosine decarboxylase-like PLP-dependent enzyme